MDIVIDRTVIETDLSLKTGRPKTRETVRYRLRHGYAHFIVCGLSVVCVFVALVTLFLPLRNLQEKGLLFPHHQDETQRRESPFSVCVDCSKLSRQHSSVHDDSLLQNFSQEFKDGTHICCARTMEQILVMFQSAIQHEDKPDSAVAIAGIKKDLLFSPVSAHKMIFPSPEMQNTNLYGGPDTTMTVPCELKLQNLLGLEHDRGVEVIREGFRLRHSGIYFVYTSIRYRPIADVSCEMFEHKTFFHFVVRISWKSYNHLLKTIHTCCDACPQDRLLKSTGGIFYLEEGDVIQNRIMGPNPGYIDPNGSYTGLVMLSSSSFNILE